MLNLLKYVKKKPLSSEDILTICENGANLLTYPELTKYKTLDEALGRKRALILLYETEQNYGHWVCVFKLNSNTIEHFDPYGLKPDKELKFVPANYRKVSGQDYPHLTALLYNSGYEITYNEYKLQKMKKDTNTCGRWVAMRIAMRMLPLEEFVKLFKLKGLTPDDVVTLLTAFI